MAHLLLMEVHTERTRRNWPIAQSAFGADDIRATHISVARDVSRSDRFATAGAAHLKTELGSARVAEGHDVLRISGLPSVGLIRPGKRFSASVWRTSSKSQAMIMGALFSCVDECVDALSTNSKNLIKSNT
jgi:hypothetical protein